MKEVLVVAAFATIPICLFGLAAWLIYKQVEGWGWFLFVVALVAGNMSFKHHSDDCKCSKGADSVKVASQEEK